MEISIENYVCGVTLRLYPHRASTKICLTTVGIEPTTFGHRYLIYTTWCIPHCGQAKIEVGSQALVVPSELAQEHDNL